MLRTTVPFVPNSESMLPAANIVRPSSGSKLLVERLFLAENVPEMLVATVMGVAPVSRSVVSSPIPSDAGHTGTHGHAFTRRLRPSHHAAKTIRQQDHTIGVTSLCCEAIPKMRSG